MLQKPGQRPSRGIPLVGLLPKPVPLAWIQDEAGGNAAGLQSPVRHDRLRHGADGVAVSVEQQQRVIDRSQVLKNIAPL